ncbi:hypothetical protein FRB90_012448 [Tulasnella sp. 427]|nr:hypothetical protein FRB90_012448 [Tulasnella sp. 427]
MDTQLFFTSRCYTLYRQNKFILGLILFEMFATLTAFAGVGVAVAHFDRFDYTPRRDLTTAASCLNLVTDLTITGLTLWKLGRGGQSYSHNTNDVLQRLRNVTIEAAVPPTVFAALNLIVYLASAQRNLAFLTFGNMTPAMYIYSMMFTLNSRHSIRKMFNSPNNPMSLEPAYEMPNVFARDDNAGQTESRRTTIVFAAGSGPKFAPNASIGIVSERAERHEERLGWEERVSGDDDENDEPTTPGASPKGDKVDLDHWESDLKESDLFRSSLVCRLWAVWASDVLWNTKPVPLTSALEATGAVTEKSIEREGETITCIHVGDIDEPGWWRFSSLSNRLTHVKVNCHLSKTTVRNVNVAKATFGGETFGRLRKSEMAVVHDEDHDAISLVAVRSLVGLCLMSAMMRETSVAWMETTLPGLAPNVNHLAIRANDSRMVDISHYSSLTTLELLCRNMSHSYWTSLADCHSLVKLGLLGTTVTSDWVEHARQPTQHDKFPALTTFVLQRGHQKILYRLMMCSSMPMLERVQCDKNTGRVGCLVQKRIRAHWEMYSPKINYQPRNVMQCAEDVIEISDFFSE